MSYAVGFMTMAIFIIILFLSVMMNISTMAADKKIPAIKEIRKAFKKGMQLAVFHHPEGYCSFVCISVIEGSNQLELDDRYGIVFKPISANQGESLDRKITIYHYITGHPYPVSVKGVAAITACKKILKKRGVTATAEKITTLMHRDLKKTNKEIRATMVPGSEDRVPDAELQIIRSAKNEMMLHKIPGSELMVFAETKDFLHGVGMSAAISLREWKSYIIAVERGGLLRPSGLNLQTKQVVGIIIAIAVGYAIVKSVNMNAFSAAGGII